MKLSKSYVITAVVGIFILLCLWLGGFDLTTRRPELGISFFWYGILLRVIWIGLNNERNAGVHEMTPPNGPPPPFPDYPDDTPRPTSPPPPRRTDRPRVIRSVQQAVAIHDALCSLGHAVRRLKEAGLSHVEIEEAFRAEMKPSWDEANE